MFFEIRTWTFTYKLFSILSTAVIASGNRNKEKNLDGATVVKFIPGVELPKYTYTLIHLHFNTPRNILFSLSGQKSFQSSKKFLISHFQFRPGVVFLASKPINHFKIDREIRQSGQNGQNGAKYGLNMGQNIYFAISRCILFREIVFKTYKSYFLSSILYHRIDDVKAFKGHFFIAFQLLLVNISYLAPFSAWFASIIPKSIDFWTKKA